MAAYFLGAAVGVCVMLFLGLSGPLSLDPPIRVGLIWCRDAEMPL